MCVACRSLFVVGSWLLVDCCVLLVFCYVLCVVVWLLVMLGCCLLVVVFVCGLVCVV